MMPPIAGYRAVAVADKWACGPLAGAVLVSPGQAMILGQLSSLQQVLAERTLRRCVMSVGAISWPLNPALVRRMFRPLWPGLVGAGGPDA